MSQTSYTAVLDRIVDDETAVLLLEDDETGDGVEGGAGDNPVDERTVPVERLPAEGAHEGAVLHVAFEDDALREATYRPDEERDRRERTQDRFDRLSDRLSEE